MTKLVLLTSSNPAIRKPMGVSVVEEGSVLTIKTIDLLVGLDYYGLTEPDQGCHIWKIDRSTFWDSRPDIPNKAGIFPLCGWDPRASAIKPGIGFDGAHLDDNLQKYNMTRGGAWREWTESIIHASSPNTHLTVGCVFLRRQNAVEDSPDIVMMLIGEGGYVQTNLEKVTIPLENTDDVLDQTVPFEITYTGPATVTGQQNLTFTVNSPINPLPPEWTTFYTWSDKGSTPTSIQLVGNQGTIPFDSSSMTQGETGTIKVGLDFLIRGRTFQVTKG